MCSLTSGRRDSDRGALWTSLAVVLVLAGCDSGAEPVIETVTVPADHPCPEIALPPSQPSLWDHLLDPATPAPLTLRIPLDASALVSQGNAQLPTHLGTAAYAWDFQVPEDTPVLAAAPGVIVWVRDDSSAFGEDTGALQDANWMVIDHGAGLFSSYVHLAQDSAQVAPGDVVAGGQPLAVTGLSGQLTGTHLHFQVENAWSETLPSAFLGLADPPACDWVPVTTEVLPPPSEVSDSLVWRGRASDVPADSFAEFGVHDLQGAPARLMSRSDRYHLSGRVDPGLSDAWALVFPEHGGDSVASKRMPVADGRFSGTLNLSGLRPGRYGWVVVAVAEGELPEAPRSVRFTLVQ